MDLPMSRKLPENKTPKRIGLTGGIGSGKSVVAKIFKALQIPVFNSDLRARSILETDLAVRKAIVNLLGKKAYHGPVPDRVFIASKVFEDERLRSELNQIVHPAVGRAFNEWVQQNTESPYLIKEAAIIFETGIHKGLDATILVVAPKDVRIDRIKVRDDMSARDVQNRMDAQWTDEKKAALADFIIHNGSNDALIPQVLSIHEKLKQL